MPLLVNDDAAKSGVFIDDLILEIMRMNFVKKSMLAATIGTLAFLPVSAFADTGSLAESIKHFPEETFLVIGFSVEHLEDDESFVQNLQEFLIEMNGERNDPMYVLGELLFNGEMKDAVKYVTSSVLNPDDDVTLNLLVGSFTKDEAAAWFKSVDEFKWHEDDGVWTYTDTEDRVHTIKVPADNHIAISNHENWMKDLAKWLGPDAKLSENAAATLSSTEGRTADFIAYMPGDTMKELAESSPEVMLFGGTVLNESKGITLMGFPGNPPTVELHLATTSEEAATQGAFLFDTGRQMLLQEIPSADAGSALGQALELVNSITSEAKGNNTKVAMNFPKETIEVFENAVQELFGGAMMGSSTTAPSPLIGEEAPEIVLTQLDGTEFNLADHRDKHIVVLDFWATWCPPCREAMPHMQEIHNDYYDKNVRFYAVNAMETDETVKEYLEKNGFTFPVPMDRTGEAASSLGLRGYPTTYIIHKDGTIQAVHVGFRPGVELKLREELDQLIAGNLLAETSTQTN